MRYIVAFHLQKRGVKCHPSGEWKTLGIYFQSCTLRGHQLEKPVSNTIITLAQSYSYMVSPIPTIIAPENHCMRAKKSPLLLMPQRINVRGKIVIATATLLDCWAFLPKAGSKYSSFSQPQRCSTAPVAGQQHLRKQTKDAGETEGVCNDLCFFCFPLGKRKNTFPHSCLQLYLYSNSRRYQTCFRAWFFFLPLSPLENWLTPDTARRDAVKAIIGQSSSNNCRPSCQVPLWVIPLLQQGRKPSN